MSKSVHYLVDTAIARGDQNEHKQELPKVKQARVQIRIPLDNVHQVLRDIAVLRAELASCEFLAGTRSRRRDNKDEEETLLKQFRIRLNAANNLINPSGHHR